MTNHKPTPSDFAALAYEISWQHLESPDQLRVEAENHEGLIIVRFPGKHSKVDHGKLIGGKGKNYRALLCILQKFAGTQKVALEILDPGGPRQDNVLRAEDPNWNQDEAFRESLQSIADKVFGYSVPVRAYSARNRTHLVIETGIIDPELLNSFQILWRAIGKRHGREFVLNAQERERQAV